MRELPSAGMWTRIRDCAPGVLVFFGIVFIGMAVFTWVSGAADNVNEYRRAVNAELKRIDSIQQNHAVAIQMLVDQARGHPLDGVASKATLLERERHETTR